MASKLALSLPIVVLLGVGPARGVTIIPLGNLFDDPAATPLATAIATDSYGAGAAATDLGVDRVTIGLGGNQLLYTGSSWSFDIQLDGTLSSGGPGNDSFRAGATQSGIRFDGVLLPVTGGGEFLEGIGMHANALISFDLDELRAAAGADASATGVFLADQYGLNDTGVENDSGDVSLWVIVSGASAPLSANCNGAAQTIVNLGGGVFSSSGTCNAQGTSNPFKRTSHQFNSNLNIPFGSDARFLTLVSTQDGGTDIFNDHGAWAGARIEIVPEPGAVFLLGLGLAGLGMVQRGRRPAWSGAGLLRARVEAEPLVAGRTLLQEDRACPRS